MSVSQAQLEGAQRDVARKALSQLASDLDGFDMDAVVNGVNAKLLADEALRDLPSKQRVHFAMRLILDVADTKAASAVAFAASEIHEHSVVLGLRAKLEEQGR